MRRLILVRHGETQPNAERKSISVSDPHLNSRGRSQADGAAAQLATETINKIFTSPMMRCRQTADAICAKQAAKPSVQVDERLLELGLGEFEGLSPSEIGERGLGPTFRAWRQGQPPAFPARAETFEQAAKRSREFFDQLMTSPHDTALIVGHSHSLRILIASCVLGASADLHRRLFLGHATITTVFWEDEVPRLESLNRAADRGQVS